MSILNNLRKIEYYHDEEAEYITDDEREFIDDVLRFAMKESRDRGIKLAGNDQIEMVADVLAQAIIDSGGGNRVKIGA